jgi:hypothetical protein
MDNAFAACKNPGRGSDIKDKDLILCMFKHYGCHGMLLACMSYNCLSKAGRSHNIMYAFQDVGV